MHLALTGVFQAHWSDDVHEEWIRNLLKNRPDLTREQLERIRHLMDKALPHATVTGYKHLVESLQLPDRDDRHVLAAAICCRASVIVTLNLADFPSATLADFSIEAQHPDDFVLALLDASPDLVLESAANHRASLRHSPKTIPQYLAALEAQGLLKSVNALRMMVDEESLLL